jgi:peptidoglycan/xylan/chitin deacetylase (PgdA/CDA1 family)
MIKINQMEKNGYFVISLDFELLWGVFDKVDYNQKIAYFQNTRKVVPEILKLFTAHEISCTWATVGMLFNENWEEWERNVPQKLPEYNDSNLCPYNFGRRIKDRGTEALCFAPDLIRMIIETPRQEMATHTYSHFYCSEEGQTLSAFKADLQKAIFMAEKYGVQLKSLVFPRNQLNGDYLALCHELGITTVRSNPDNWYWKETQQSSLLKRLFRTGDAYYGTYDKSYPLTAVSKTPGKPGQQKASRLLRPFSPVRWLNSLKIARIKAEMTAAAKKKEVYHLWWHPHNFGEHPEENLADLREIVHHFDDLKKLYNFRSRHMAGLMEQVEGSKNEKVF